MDTLAPASINHARLRLATARATEFVDLTDRLERFVAGAGICSGVLAVLTLHSTTAIVVNEREPQLPGDFWGALPLPSSAALLVADGRLQLGRWQRVFLVELDGPRERDVTLLAFGESAA